MTVELLRAGIAKMSQGSCTGFERFMERLSVCVSVSQADAYAQFFGFSDECHASLTFGGQGEQDRVCLGDGSDVFQMLRPWGLHALGIMSASIASFR